MVNDSPELFRLGGFLGVRYGAYIRILLVQLDFFGSKSPVRDDKLRLFNNGVPGFHPYQGPAGEGGGGDRQHCGQYALVPVAKAEKGRPGEPFTLPVNQHRPGTPTELRRSEGVLEALLRDSPLEGFFAVAGTKGRGHRFPGPGFPGEQCQRGRQGLDNCLGSYFSNLNGGLGGRLRNSLPGCGRLVRLFVRFPGRLAPKPGEAAWQGDAYQEEEKDKKQ
jgi:hypothetical protein